uniref:Ubiquitin carboxyl-terminal hydrolase n=1 Tax=Fabrea salina TaxID=342563 RepID=A0A7S3I8U5_9CILI|mmetsp:Transcript_1142/g.1837  ORF Transcript_1142/g.1837 Transcript_1142/m.1837 type:complete len:342 (+) Transcript_1142:843-1868(+)
MGDWCTIESDPGVFTELIQKIGVKGVEVEEVFSLDSLDEIKPVYGLIFLFKWVQAQPREYLEYYDPDLFFANQVITNACATQAILSILLNCPQLEIGQELTNLREFAMPLDAQTRGLTISNSELIKNTHNSFSRQEAFDFGKAKATEKEDVYHFVSYVPFKGKLYELDGLQPGPIMLDECSEEDWLEKVKPAILDRIQKYSENEIRFNLLALVKDKKSSAEEETKKLNSEIAAIQSKLASLGEEVQGMEVEVDEEYFSALPDDLEALQGELAAKKHQLEQYSDIIKAEENKHLRWKQENARRRHNYIPFIVTLLEKLAEQDRLLPLLEEAKKRKTERTSGN